MFLLKMTNIEKFSNYGNFLPADSTCFVKILPKELRYIIYHYLDINSLEQLILSNKQIYDELRIKEFWIQYCKNNNIELINENIYNASKWIKEIHCLININNYINIINKHDCVICEMKRDDIYEKPLFSSSCQEKDLYCKKYKCSLGNLYHNNLSIPLYENEINILCQYIDDNRVVERIKSLYVSNRLIIKYDGLTIESGMITLCNINIFHMRKILYQIYNNILLI